MKCPICSAKTKVIDVRDRERFYRRRECKSCGERFTTYEFSVDSLLDLFDEFMSESEVDRAAEALNNIFDVKVGDPMNAPRYKYAVYKGEAMLSVGTIPECAKELGLKPSTLYFYTSPAYQRRIKSDNWITVTKIGKVE